MVTVGDFTSSALSAGIIAAIVIGSILGLALIIFVIVLIYCLCCKKKTTFAGAVVKPAPYSAGPSGRYWSTHRLQFPLLFIQFYGPDTLRIRFESKSTVINTSSFSFCLQENESPKRFLQRLKLLLFFFLFHWWVNLALVCAQRIAGTRHKSANDSKTIWERCLFASFNLSGYKRRFSCFFVESKEKRLPTTNDTSKSITWK